MANRRTGVLLILLLSAATLGCVERRMVLKTVPADAEVYLDGRLIGQSPMLIPFTHYGTREFVVRKAGYRTLRELKVMQPPPFQEFPWDIYYETMTSDLYTDERTYSFVLEPVDETDTARSVVEQKLLEAKELRER